MGESRLNKWLERPVSPVVSVLVIIGVLFLVAIISEHTQQQPAQTAQVVQPAQKAAKPTKQLSKQDREEKIRRQFAFWDGSHIGLKWYIKERMYDPGSFKHIKTTYVDMGDHLLVTTVFRGKNALGAWVINEVTAEVDLDGNVIGIDSWTAPGLDLGY